MSHYPAQGHNNNPNQPPQNHHEYQSFHHNQMESNEAEINLQSRQQQAFIQTSIQKGVGTPPSAAQGAEILQEGRAAGFLPRQISNQRASNQEDEEMMEDLADDFAEIHDQLGHQTPPNSSNQEPASGHIYVGGAPHNNAHHHQIYVQQQENYEDSDEYECEGLDQKPGYALDPQQADGVIMQSNSMSQPQQPQQEDLISLQNLVQQDPRFYSLEELDEREEELKAECLIYGGSEANPHVLLTPTEYRAKLYILTRETRWMDIGTGQFRILLSKDGLEHYMQIVSESSLRAAHQQQQRRLSADEDTPYDQEGQQDSGASEGGQLLHRSFIHNQTDFQRQRDTIITWQDSSGRDYALSFQDHRGAQNTWFSICFLRGIQVSASLEDQTNADINGAESEEGAQEEVIQSPTVDNLQEILNELIDSDPYTRRRIAQAVLKTPTNERLSSGNNQDGAQTNSNALQNESNNQVPAVNNLVSAVQGHDDDDEVVDTMGMWEQQEGRLEFGGKDNDGTDPSPTLTQIQSTTYLNKLQQVFNQIEETYLGALDQQLYTNAQASQNNLDILYQIYRHLLSLNERELIEVLVNESYWRTTFGALEYDPDVQIASQTAVEQALLKPAGHSIASEFQADLAVEDFRPASPGPISSLASEKDSMVVHGRSLTPTRKSLQAIQNTMAGFRDFLENKVKFRTAVPINCPVTVQAIHSTYRLQYLKDTAMARFIDETTSHTITQLIIKNQQLILEYIFGADNFDRIQDCLLEKMNSADAKEKNLALQFIIEICGLLKSIQINHRFPYHLQQELTKLMTVLSQTFEIMIPTQRTLARATEGNISRLVDAFQEDGPSMGAVPSRELCFEYLRNQIQEDDPNLTQLDMLKANGIEIFYHLLVVQTNNFNTKNFLCSEEQQRQNYPFLCSLARHMIFSNQMGIKTSICEFLKDLIPSQDQPQGQTQQAQQEANYNEFQPQMPHQQSNQSSPSNTNPLLAPNPILGKKNASLPLVILEEVISRIFVDFLEKSNEQLKADQLDWQGELNSAAFKTYEKELEQSKVLVLQFMTKFVQDGPNQVETRLNFVTHKVFQKVTNLMHDKSAHLNVEIVKFLKACIMLKDKSTILYLIKKDILLQICDMYLDNENKGNLLSSTILSLLEKIFQNFPTDLLQMYLKKLVNAGYEKKIFLHPEHGANFKKWAQTIVAYMETQNQSIQGHSAQMSRAGSMGSVNVNADGFRERERRSKSHNDRSSQSAEEKHSDPCMQDQEDDDWQEGDHHHQEGVGLAGEVDSNEEAALLSAAFGGPEVIGDKTRQQFTDDNYGKQIDQNDDAELSAEEQERLDEEFNQKQLARLKELQHERVQEGGNSRFHLPLSQQLQDRYSRLSRSEDRGELSGEQATPALSFQAQALSAKAAPQIVVRSARSMSPIRDISSDPSHLQKLSHKLGLPQSVNNFNEFKPVGSRLTPQKNSEDSASRLKFSNMGAIDEIEVMQRRERSGSDDLQEGSGSAQNIFASIDQIDPMKKHPSHPNQIRKFLSAANNRGQSEERARSRGSSKSSQNKLEALESDDFMKVHQAAMAVQDQSKDGSGSNVPLRTPPRQLSQGNVERTMAQAFGPVKSTSNASLEKSSNKEAHVVPNTQTNQEILSKRNWSDKDREANQEEDFQQSLQVDDERESKNASKRQKTDD